MITITDSGQVPMEGRLPSAQGDKQGRAGKREG